MYKIDMIRIYIYIYILNQLALLLALQAALKGNV